MIKRIVKLTFHPEQTDAFLEIFENSKSRIRQFEGCHHLELWRSKEQAHVFFTYSFWDDQAALDRYRHSELFQQTWSLTKKLFSDKPLAWSVEMMDIVRN
ncbi:MAG: antibiotic biosynthesis monooxygenase family protein [Bacteroidota bacterium]